MRRKMWCLSLMLLLPVAVLLGGCPPEDPEGIPEAVFSADILYGKPSLTVTFTDASTPGDAPITSWLWDFGDDTSSTEQHPVHVYEDAGTYTVTLTVSNEVGSKTEEKNAYIIVGNVWSRHYGGATLDEGRGVCAAGDGDYMVVGSTVIAEGDTDLYVVRVDKNGDEVWSKTFGGEGRDDAYGVIKTSGLNFIIVGSTTSYGAGGSDLWLLCIDEDGVELWSNTYGGTSSDYGYAVIETKEGGFAAVGQSYSGGVGLGDAFMVKTNSTGEETWKAYYGEAGPDAAWAVRQSNDGNYILAGETCTTLFSDSDMYLVRTDAAGTELWSKMYGNTGEDKAYDVVLSNDGGYMLCGSYNTLSYSGVDMIALHVDEAGEEIWSAVYGGSKHEEARSLVRIGSFYCLAGYTNSAGEGGQDCYVVKIDGNGEAEWKHTFGGPGTDNAKQIRKVSGGYLVVGNTASWGEGDGDVYLFRHNEDGYGPSEPPAETE